ncbi:signal peptide, CUB and EGF-like domain-containing protein 1 isoform X2 [Anabrus simplex]|uniref:signal peptide, CUB and EGF-like domain-containing protein 1 isoform X2 n=1 Tax=Anabrus simplex TaxID=316456 RepID=UPI0035A38454
MDRSVTVAFVCLLLSVSVKDTTAQADPGENCATDSDCQRSATCINNKCICKPEYKLDTQLNKCRAGLGQRCKDTNECYIHDHPNRVECNRFNKTCTCTRGFVASADSLYCNGDAGIIAQLTSGVILLAMFVITRIIY